MTRDDIIRMAREAGIDIGIWEKLDDQDTCFGYSIDGIHENLERFADMIAAHEREACAKVADEWVHAYEHPSKVIAETIRKRGQA